MIELFSKDKSIGEKSFKECREFAISKEFTRQDDGRAGEKDAGEYPQPWSGDLYQDMDADDHGKLGWNAEDVLGADGSGRYAEWFHRLWSVEEI